MHSLKAAAARIPSKTLISPAHIQNNPPYMKVSKNGNAQAGFINMSLSSYSHREMGKSHVQKGAHSGILL
jgi:hypothetical protein